MTQILALFQYQDSSYSYLHGLKFKNLLMGIQLYICLFAFRWTIFFQN